MCIVGKLIIVYHMDLGLYWRKIDRVLVGFCMGSLSRDAFWITRTSVTDCDTCMNSPISGPSAAPSWCGPTENTSGCNKT